MAIWKLLLMMIAWVFGTVSAGGAETALVIVTGEIPPAISKQSEKSFLTGLFQAVEKEMGVKFIFKFMPWKRCETALKELEAWGAIPYVRTPEREKDFYFSERLYNSSSKFFGYASGGGMENISYTELSDLANYRIGGVRGYWYVKFFRDVGINPELVTDEYQNIIRLRTGRIDLAPLDETAGWYMIRTLLPLESGNFFTVAKPFSVKDSFLMTSKQYPDTQNLLAEFNAALQTIKDTGVFQQIAEKHGVMYAP